MANEEVGLAGLTPICLCCFGRGGSNIGWNLIGSSVDVLMTAEEWHRAVFLGPTTRPLRRLVVGASRRFSVEVAPPVVQRALASLYSKTVRDRTLAVVLHEDIMSKPNARYISLKVMDYHIDLLPTIEQAFGVAPRVSVLTREAQPQIEGLLRSGLTLRQACSWYRDVARRMEVLLRRPGAVELPFERLLEDPATAVASLYRNLGLAPPPDGKFRVNRKLYGSARDETTDVTPRQALRLELSELAGYIDPDVNRKAVARLTPEQIAYIEGLRLSA